jgi:antirestriction protein ArdC
MTDHPDTGARKMAKFDLYQTVTDNIIAAIEQGGELPWVRPWTTTGGPRNGMTGRAYSGVNHLLLTIAGAKYSSAEWFTFKNAQKLGGSVRKGEKGTQVVFWNIISKKNEVGKDETIPLLRYFLVFNRDQIDGLPAPKVAERPEFNSVEVAEAFIAATGANITFGGDRACYNMVTDSITLPTQESFVDAGAYYATAFHELVHWTGHQSRLDRLKATPFGSPEYAKEELVAELGAAFLCAEYGIDGKTQHPEYIKNWLAVLKDDKRFIFRASSLANKAVALLNGSDEEGAGE